MGTDPGSGRRLEDLRRRLTLSAERLWVSALLVITVAMGMLDAVSLLHLGTFTGYMTGTVILIGVGLAHASQVTAAAVVALSAFVIGAFLGGRLVRRAHPSPRLVGDVLIGVGGLVFAAAALAALHDRLPIVLVLGLAMGLQTSATRHAGVADMAMPAATMILHGLAHDSRLAGGGAEHALRRVSILAGLLGGAVLGTWLSSLSLALALGTVALLIFGAALMLRLHRTQPA